MGLLLQLAFQSRRPVTKWAAPRRGRPLSWWSDVQREVRDGDDVVASPADALQQDGVAIDRHGRIAASGRDHNVAVEIESRDAGVAARGIVGREVEQVLIGERAVRWQKSVMTLLPSRWTELSVAVASTCHHVVARAADQHVVASTAVEGVGARPAIERVGATLAAQHVVAAAEIGNDVDAPVASAVDVGQRRQVQVLDIVAEREADRAVDGIGAAGGVLRHRVAGPHEVGVVARSAGQVSIAASPVERSLPDPVVTFSMPMMAPVALPTAVLKPVAEPLARFTTTEVVI